MKFSTRDRYALRLMTELADHGGALVPLKEISTAQQISLKYLEQIITPLARAGLVASVRGAQGGYRLARPAEEITRGYPAGRGGRTDRHPLPGRAGRLPAPGPVPDARLLVWPQRSDQSVCGQHHPGPAVRHG